MKVNWLALRGAFKNDDVLLLPISVEEDEQWSFVGQKSHQRWLWVALNHRTSEILAYTFGERSNQICKRLQKLLAPFSIVKYFTDGLITYQQCLTKDKHAIGKRNTQKIERKFLTLRTRIKRLARKTPCFSKSAFMHDTVIGLFINRVEFCRNV